MKITKLLSGLICLFIISSCIQSEPLNAECDILKVHLENEYLKGEPIVENDRIIFLAKPFIDLTALAPSFTLTEGATISPASGTELDFTKPQHYTVTSQDGNWSKTYEVNFNMDEMKTRYSFEHFEVKDSVKNNYYVFYEEGQSGKQYLWATGNAGYKISNQSAPRDKYPTAIESEGVAGYAVSLVTRSTGDFGVGVKMPIAAGNLFIGTFNILSAITKPLEATHFGTPFASKPARLKGWYKYKPGEVFTDKYSNVIEDRVDEFDIYAVFYEPTQEIPYLTGGNVLTAENIIALARLEDRSEKANFTEFNIPFVYRDGKEVDDEKLKDFKYNIAIVFSSSIDGAIFQGAVGSTLIVDEVELICEAN